MMLPAILSLIVNEADVISFYICFQIKVHLEWQVVEVEAKNRHPVKSSTKLHQE